MKHQRPPLPSFVIFKVAVGVLIIWPLQMSLKWWGGGGRLKTDPPLLFLVSPPSSSSSPLSSYSLFSCCLLLLLLSSFMLRGLGSSFSICSAQRSTLSGRAGWNCCCSLWCVRGSHGRCLLPSLLTFIFLSVVFLFHLWFFPPQLSDVKPATACWSEFVTIRFNATKLFQYKDILMHKNKHGKRKQKETWTEVKNGDVQ